MKLIAESRFSLDNNLYSLLAILMIERDMNKNKIEKAVRQILEAIGENPSNINR